MSRPGVPKIVTPIEGIPKTKSGRKQPSTPAVNVPTALIIFLGQSLVAFPNFLIAAFAVGKKRH